VADRLKAAVEVESARDFVGGTLVVDEAIFARGSDSLIVEAHRVQVAALDACDLGCDQGVLIAKGRRIVIRPLAKLLYMRGERLAPFALSVRRGRVKDRRDRERSVVVVVQQLDAAGGGGQQLLCLRGGREGGLVVTQNEPRL
jgi:hypothetical protein